MDERAIASPVMRVEGGSNGCCDESMPLPPDQHYVRKGSLKKTWLCAQVFDDFMMFCA
jgi:hypothetical protein